LDGKLSITQAAVFVVVGCSQAHLQVLLYLTILALGPAAQVRLEVAIVS
jgi:hypothetical protein